MVFCMDFLEAGDEDKGSRLPSSVFASQEMNVTQLRSENAVPRVALASMCHLLCCHGVSGCVGYDVGG